MSRKANTTVIGAFVVGAIVLVVAGIMVFGGGQFFKETKRFVLFFGGSVQGLNKGAPVAFKGVRVGSVVEVKVLLDSRDLSLQIPVIIEIEPDRISALRGERWDQLTEVTDGRSLIDYMVEKGLRAQLDMQSLVTGQLFVNLDFFPHKPARFVNIETGFTEIPTVPSSLELISKTVEKLPISELASKANRVLRGLEHWINSPELQEIMTNLSQALKEVREAMQKINGQTEPILTKLDGTLGEAYETLHEIRPNVKPLMADVRDVAKGARSLVGEVNGHVGKLAVSLETVLRAAEKAIKKADGTLVGLESIVNEDSGVRHELYSALKELSAAARSIRILADYLERHPEALLHGKGEYGGKPK